MQCRRHPGRPAVGTCSVCNSFVCQSCADLIRRGDQLMCTDCHLLWIRTRVEDILLPLRYGIATGAAVLVIAEVYFLVMGPSVVTALIGAFLAYVIGAAWIGWGEALHDGIRGPWAVVIVGIATGAFRAPWAIINNVQELETLREREGIVMATRGAT